MTTATKTKTAKTTGAANPVIGGVSLSAFLAAIASKESGNYAAVNPDSGALGKYQVLPSNVPSWSQEALGYTITPAQFLASPTAQEKIVRYKLGGYFRSYGPLGAASAWYSGSPKNVNSTTPNGIYPSVATYVQNVYNAARANMHLTPKQLQLGAATGGSGVGSTTSGTVQTAGFPNPLNLITDPFKWLAGKTVTPIIVSTEKLATQSLIVLAGVGIIVVGAYIAFKKDDDGNGGGGGMLMPAPAGGAKAGAGVSAGEAAELAPMAALA
jgi:hypothetical protein